MGVPDVLLSGDHGKVDRFRRDEALARTDAIRPDLIEQLDQLLAEVTPLQPAWPGVDVAADCRGRGLFGTDLIE